MRRLAHRLSHLETHHRFGLSLAAAILVALAGIGRLRPPVASILAWDAYALCFIGLAWIRILTAQPRAVVRLARLQHASRTTLVVFVLIAALVSLASVVGLLAGARELTGAAWARHVALALGTVALSWVLVHTLFTLYYAYLYYRHAVRQNLDRGMGLGFPGEQEPDYLDFAYFSFVIGMTSQVSDVAVQSRELRRWVLVHGIVAFCFNAAILALGINTLSGLF